MRHRARGGYRVSRYYRRVSTWNDGARFARFPGRFLARGRASRGCSRFDRRPLRIEPRHNVAIVRDP